MTLLIETTVRMTTLLAVVLAVLPLLRRQSAGVRAALLASALAGCALLPLLSPVAPRWGAPLDAQLAPVSPWASWLVAVWIAGMGANLLVVGAGLIRLMGMAAAADPVRDGRLADHALDIAGDLKLPAPVLILMSQQPLLPMTWGHLQPKVLLPCDAASWSDERLTMVLRHELAHVKRRDWLVQLFASLLRSVVWFHPLAWLACRRLRLEAERACDDAVLRGSVSGTAYASHLLDLARMFLAGRGLRAAAHFARRSTLEARVRAMLDDSISHGPAPRGTRAALAAAAVASVCLAGLGAALPPPSPTVVLPPATRLTLLLDGRIVDLSKGLPPQPDPRAGLVRGPGLLPHLGLQ